MSYQPRCLVCNRLDGEGHESYCTVGEFQQQCSREQMAAKKADTNLSQTDYDALVRDAMAWRSSHKLLCFSADYDDALKIIRTMRNNLPAPPLTSAEEGELMALHSWSPRTKEQEARFCELQKRDALSATWDGLGPEWDTWKLKQRIKILETACRAIDEAYKTPDSEDYSAAMYDAVIKVRRVLNQEK